MYSQGLLVIALATGTLSFSKVEANLEPFPVVTYEDIELLSATIPKKDNCAVERTHENLDDFNCNCDEFCTLYDTCCVDSKYRDKKRKIRKPFKCVKLNKSLNEKPVYLIDSCDTTWSGDNHTEELCTARAQDKDNLFLSIPVTNHKTRITYKNYFCAVCNNDTGKDQLTLWHMSLNRWPRAVKILPLIDVHFFSEGYPLGGHWMVGNDTNHVAVYPVITAPEEIKGMVHDCQYDVISRCASDWNDTVIEDKCAAYMAIKRTDEHSYYRNPHCAICNHISLETLRSMYISFRQPPGNLRPMSDTFFVRLFSMYDKESKCDDSQVYDTLAKKCRKVYKG